MNSKTIFRSAASYARESGLPVAMTRRILTRIEKSLSARSLASLKKKLQRHPVLGKSRKWAWVAPGNVPDPVVLAVVSARLQNARLILKLARRAEKTGRALVRRFAAKGQNVQVVTEPAAFRFLSASADAKIVYGDDTTLQTLRAQSRASQRWLGHGHRISFSVVFRSAIALTPDLNRVARAAAEDIWLYDQRGCLSPQVIWVEGPAEPFAAELLRALQDLARKHGPVRRGSEDLARRRAALGEIRIRALDPRVLELKVGSGANPGSAQDPAVYLLKKGRFSKPATGQIIAVKSFATAAQIRREMTPFFRRLQAVATAGTPSEAARIRSLFQKSPATYFPAVGHLQAPPIDWQF